MRNLVFYFFMAISIMMPTTAEAVRDDCVFFYYNTGGYGGATVQACGRNGDMWDRWLSKDDIWLDLEKDTIREKMFGFRCGRNIKIIQFKIPHDNDKGFDYPVLKCETGRVLEVPDRIRKRAIDLRIMPDRAKIRDEVQVRDKCVKFFRDANGKGPSINRCWWVAGNKYQDFGDAKNPQRLHYKISSFKCGRKVTSVKFININDPNKGRFSKEIFYCHLDGPVNLPASIENKATGAKLFAGRARKQLPGRTTECGIECSGECDYQPVHNKWCSQCKTECVGKVWTGQYQSPPRLWRSAAVKWETKRSCPSVCIMERRYENDATYRRCLSLCEQKNVSLPAEKSYVSPANSTRPSKTLASPSSKWIMTGDYCRQKVDKSKWGYYANAYGGVPCCCFGGVDKPAMKSSGGYQECVSCPEPPKEVGRPCVTGFFTAGTCSQCPDTKRKTWASAGAARAGAAELKVYCCDNCKGTPQMENRSVIAGFREPFCKCAAP